MTEKLSERVERLEGPDRDWDTEIAHACGAEYGHKSGWCDNESGDYWTVENSALHYTASLDAAMSLVPEGSDFGIGSFDDSTKTPWAWVGSFDHEAHAATPAIALCAAALKARGL